MGNYKYTAITTEPGTSWEGWFTRGVPGTPDAVGTPSSTYRCTVKKYKKYMWVYRMSDEFDIAEFCIGNSTSPRIHKSPRFQKTKRIDRASVRPFIVATPLEWETAAARLPGKALHVARALRYISGLTKTNNGIKMQSKVLALFGVSHKAYNRCLRLLETAGLVTVERFPGQTPVVSILDG